MRKENITGYEEFVIEYFRGVIIFGVILLAVSIWVYEYHYTETGDDIMGMAAAAALFFGTILVGEGIRGWRDGEDFRNRFIQMRSRQGADVTITKRGKKRF